ncbi:hypothetical protein GGR57DRAFT_503033 [Xylariaceae sp. FL1272]|nr:hypothetical protein GGR57DRAFT_503033 [Xylariaceae sp. FL1272]
MSNQFEAIMQAKLLLTIQDERAQPWKLSVDTRASFDSEEWISIDNSPATEQKPDARTQAFPIGEVEQSADGHFGVLTNAFPIGNINAMTNAFPVGHVNAMTNAFPVGDVNAMTNLFPTGNINVMTNSFPA